MFREPNDKNYDVLLAENRFVSEVQLVIERTMEEMNFSQADLARALDVTEARVSQILASNGKNLQARTIARIAHVLGMEVAIDFCAKQAHAKQDEPVPLCGDKGRSFDAWIRSIQHTKQSAWEMPCNDDEAPLWQKERQRA
jgi:transcriptional regulator with XRE-family HTH domain